MRRLLFVLLPLAIAACAAPPRGQAPAPPVAHEAPVSMTSAEVWQVTDSHLEIRVYRDGPMQKLGHDHLITSDRVAGEVELREPLATSRFALRLPLDSLVVDDAAARSRAGGPFDAPVPEKDREATRRNMLGDRLLDAARQGEILLTMDSITGGPRHYEAQVRVALAGHEHVLAAPFELTIDGGRLAAHARLRLTHADLGLVPFAVALGALRVRDDFEVELTVEAGRRT
jgi:hypothetical protein